MILILPFFLTISSMPAPMREKMLDRKYPTALSYATASLKQGKKKVRAGSSSNVL
jgi:hypothetical protein